MARRLEGRRPQEADGLDEVLTVDGEALVRASGGVVWRPAAVGVEVLLVHRPRYDDWTLPKGKADEGESDEACAVREVEEETGLRCVLGHELPSSRYVDNRGRPKLVRYWEMTVAEDGPWEAGDEIDELRWLALDEAEQLLSYGRDVAVLDAFAEWAGVRRG